MQRINIYRPYKDNHVVDPIKPFFYIIQHVPSGKYYAGYKYQKRNGLMTPSGYKTSSKTIKKIVKLEGLTVWKIMRIRYFDTKEEAFCYERKFLKRINVPQNTTFYNRIIPGDWDLGFSIRGIPLSKEHRQKISTSHIGMSHTKETRQKLSKAHKGKILSPEHRQKLSKAHLGAPGVNTGKKWWNNGIKTHLALECPGKEWLPGRAQFY